MPRPKIIHLSQETVDNMQLTAPNLVLVHIFQKNVDRKTEGGIIMISETETDWQPDVHADRVGIVKHVPSQLIKKRDHLWKTTVEVKVGDMVWFDPMVAMNSDIIITDQGEYYLLDYFSLHIVRRGDDVVCLNGYCIFDLVHDTSMSPLAIDFGKLDSRYGILKYKGSCNSYYYTGLSDDERLEIGDKCIFKSPPVTLEGGYHNVFEGKEQYRISQRYNAVGFIRDGRLYASTNHVVIVPQMPSHTASGLEIPAPYRKPNGYGEVYDSGYYELSKGDHIKYPIGSFVTIEFEGQTLHIIHSDYIQVKMLV